ncbi:MAG: chromate resistance protein, partial [Magnetococcales bacterium]|nr:chromate resistance protein [Magnetococcales bacterium]
MSSGHEGVALFLVIVLTLPSRNATERMRAWRTLKAWGCAVLRDGVYLLPAGDRAQRHLDDLAAEVRAAGGQAEVLSVLPQIEEQHARFCALFNRDAEYAVLLGEIEALDPVGLDLPHLRRAVRSLRRRYDALTEIDYFPGPDQGAVGARLAEAEAALAAQLSPGEPQAQPEEAVIAHLDAHAFQGCLWTTRRGLWVDRLASAWLIHRFIDHEARFVWFPAGEPPPPEAIGFDFDGARFPHVGP